MYSGAPSASTDNAAYLKFYFEQTKAFILVQNIQLTVSVVGFIAFFREKPTNPPSPEANVKPQKIELRESFGQCFANKGFVIVCVNFACMYGAFAAMSDVLSLVFTSYNSLRVSDDIKPYKTAEVSAYGALTTIAGVSCSFTSAILLKKYGKFLVPMRVFITLTGLMMLLALIFVPKGGFVGVGIILMLLGMSLVPLIPLSYAYASKLTYPMDPPTTQGILLMSGMGFGAIEGTIGTFICQVDPRILIALWILQAMIALANTFRMPEEEEIKDEKIQLSVWGDRMSIQILPIEGATDLNDTGFFDGKEQSYMSLAIDEAQTQ